MLNEDVFDEQSQWEIIKYEMQNFQYATRR